MKLLTLEEVKQNFIEKFSNDLKTSIDEDIDEDEDNDRLIQEMNDEIDELKKQLDEVKTIKQFAPFFDDERIDSWDVHSMIEFCLQCSCQE